MKFLTTLTIGILLLGSCVTLHAQEMKLKEFHEKLDQKLAKLKAKIIDKGELGKICNEMADLLPDALPEEGDVEMPPLKSQLRTLIGFVVTNYPSIENPQEWTTFTFEALDILEPINKKDLTLWNATIAEVVKKLRAINEESEESPATPSVKELVAPADSFGVVAKLIEMVGVYQGNLRFDLIPDVTAQKFQTMYQEMGAEVKKFKNDKISPEDFTKLLTTHKQKLDTIFEARPGREDAWEEYFKDLVSSLQEAINNGKFDATSKSQWIKLFAELDAGFHEVEKLMTARRNLPGSGTAASGISGGGGSGIFVGGGGTSIAAVHHARVMSRIQGRQTRRGYRIERISGRR